MSFNPKHVIGKKIVRIDMRPSVEESDRSTRSEMSTAWTSSEGENRE